VLFLEDLGGSPRARDALSRTEPDGFSRTSYAELRSRARATAVRLRAAGVEPGDRVLLAGNNHPDWPIAYFGIVYAGAVCVPIDRELSSDARAGIATASGAKVALLDDGRAARFGRRRRSGDCARRGHCGRAARRLRSARGRRRHAREQSSTRRARPACPRA
jgi:acyl-CoA synthetase (AMP-forming)/AMP-acid ligase II